MKRKLLSIVLALTMALGMLPAAALADEEGGTPTTYVAQAGGVKYATLQAAIDAAKSKTVELLADTRENVTIDKAMTLDLNGHTLNGSTGERKPALTITARGVTVKDSSEEQTGTIMREDTAENSGVSSHYVIDVQGNGWLTFESGTVKNGSGAGGTKGASLVRVGNDSVAKYPGLNIKGGTFTQDNFIVIKVDRGDLFLNGGTLNSANSYAVENWFRATIKGGTVNGAVSSWTYSGGSNSTLEISGGTVNGAVTSVNYGDADKVAKVEITGGTVTGELDTRSYDPTTGKLTSITDVAKSIIKVTGGTFSSDPSAYLVEGSTATPNSNGTYGVAKAYLAQVGETSYYTMDEAFKAQTKNGEPVVLLRDYTTGGTFNSGSINRTVDLNGHTWTCTGTDANSAAFEINYADASLTVKNGKIVSSQLVGLIPSASGGTIKYDNSSLTFENVEMSTTATSGIETNGNNTNDTVTLINSTLNVPNGFGIYFPSSGKLTIDNSTINAMTMGVQVCAGSLSINAGSTITVSGDAVPKAEGDGAIQDGAAISIVNRTGYKGLGTVAVTGGKFTAKAKNDALKAYKWENQTESSFDNSTNIIAVSGGTFTSAVPQNCCAPGFEPTQNNDGTHGVKTKANMAAEVLDAQGKTVGAYNTLTDAIAAAKDGETVTLLKDAKTTVELSFTNKAITLDLNGKTVSGTFTDNFSVIEAGADASLTVQDTSVAGTGKIASDKYGISARDGGALIVKSGTIASEYAPLSGNNTAGNMNFTVNGGTLTAKSGPAIYMPGQVSLTITDGVLNGGISLRMGQVNISGGTINAITTGIDMPTDNLSGKPAYAYSGNVWFPDALYVIGGTYTSTDATYGNSLKMNITGGTFNCTNGKGSAVAIYDLGKVAQTANVTISGDAKFETNSAERNAYQVVSFADMNATPITGYGNTEMVGKVASAISGGTFSSEVKPEYCAEGYIPKGNGDGTYGVTEPSSSSSSRSSVTAPKADHGTVTVSPKSASKGDTVTVTVKPDSGYVLETLTVTDKNGNELTLKDKGNGKYTFTMPRGAVTVKATFMEDNTVLNFFYDVPNDAYYYEAVKWAVEKGITSGIGNDLFGSNDPCTRAQIVTFLWRAAGSPEPKALSSFTDVPADAWYAKAVAWAVENGVTAGVGDGLFGSDDTCTRAQSVTFLFKALKAAAKGQADFKDVSASDWYAKAVAWAVENGVTAGVGGGLFGSGDDCTRAQIVTFLFKAYQGK